VAEGLASVALFLVLGPTRIPPTAPGVTSGPTVATRRNPRFRCPRRPSPADRSTAIGTGMS